MVSGEFGATAVGAHFVGSTSVALPVFTPNTVMRFRLVCSPSPMATLTEATMGVVAGPVDG